MRTNLYIPDEKTEVYERAKAELGDSLSATFVRCLENELRLKQLQQRRIVFDARTADGGASKKAFEGHWLIGSTERPAQFTDESGNIVRFHPSGDVARYAVARSTKGKIVVLYLDENGCRAFAPFDTFEEFRDSPNRHPLALVEAVGKQLGVQVVEELDL